MVQIDFLIITFDSKVQMTSGFHCCASFDEIFHRTPIMIIIFNNWGGAIGSKRPKMTNDKGGRAVLSLKTNQSSSFWSKCAPSTLRPLRPSMGPKGLLMRLKATY